MDLSDPNTWTVGLSVVTSAPHIVIPLLIAVAVVVWWFRGTVERARRDGLQSIVNGRDAQIVALNMQIALGKDRFQIATDLQKLLSTKLASAEKESAKLKEQTEQNASLEAIAATARSTATLVTDLVTANTVLLDLLRLESSNKSQVLASAEILRLKTRADKLPPVASLSE